MGLKLISYTEKYTEQAKVVADRAGGELVLFESVDDLLGLVEQAEDIEQWHVLADAGVYGFICGANDFPEVVGRQQWLDLKLPLAEGATIALYHDYADRWLAPLLARTFKVPVEAVQQSRVFTAEQSDTDQSYDSSAALYDAAFEDLKVRDIEWDYVVEKLKQWAECHGRLPRVVEVGCGNGQMMRQLLGEGLIAGAIGLDASPGMVKAAQARHKGVSDLQFRQIEKSHLPFEDGTVDVVISFMSYRYLDWEPLAREIRRVLIPVGMFLMVDMAETELSEVDRPLYEVTKKRTAELHVGNPVFAANLKALVEHPEWKAMLEFHPKRLACEYESFLTSRFPEGEWQRLYVCFDHSLFSFHVVLG